MTTFTPQQTRLWSTRELGRLIGRHIEITLNGGSSDGVVADAGIGRFGQVWVDYEGGGTESWDRDSDEVRIEMLPVPYHPDAPHARRLACTPECNNATNPRYDDSVEG
ncbi:MAG: hypothetical protein ABW022_14825 [Actinoplanes sp.]